MPESLLELKNLAFAYPGCAPVLNGLNLSLRKGETLGLAGANGSGKTTLFRCITGLEKISGGEIILLGAKVKSERDFQSLRKKVGFCLQNAEDQLIFPTALEDASFGPLNLGLAQTEAEERGRWALDLFGAGAFADRLTHELSGGQQKLVALASVLAMRPAILLLDEPFNGLDVNARQTVAQTLQSLDCAKIIVAHDDSLLASLCDRILVLKNGKLKIAGQIAQ